MRAFLGVLVLAILLPLGAAAQPAEPPPNPRAEALNEEGKKLYAEKKDYVASTQKFEAAIAIDPNPRYYFNLCAAYEKLEQYEKALEACDEVFARNARDELQQKTGKRAAAIRAKMRQQPTNPNQPPPDPNNPNNPPPDPNNPNNPTNPNPTNPQYPPPYSPPGATAPAGEVENEDVSAYRWGLTFAAGPVANLSVGDGDFGRGGFGLRIGADFILSSKARLGIEPYFQYAVIPGGVADFQGQRELSLLDLGAALFWHKRIVGRLFFRPLAGVQVTGIQPYNTGRSESFLTFGLRADASLEYVFGGGTHVLSLTPLAINFYLPSASQVVGDLAASAYGFDKGGATYSFNIAYTVRFKKGLLPGLFTLE